MSKNSTEANLKKANIEKENNKRVQNAAVRHVVAEQAEYQNFLRQYWEKEAQAEAPRKADPKIETTVSEAYVPLKDNTSTEFPAHLLAPRTPFESILVGLQKIENTLHREIATDMVQSIGEQGFEKLVQDANTKAAAANQANANARPPAQNPEAGSSSETHSSSGNLQSSEPTEKTTQNSSNESFTSDDNENDFQQSADDFQNSTVDQSAVFYFKENVRALLEPKCKAASKHYGLDYAALRKDTVIIITDLSVHHYGHLLIVEERKTLVTVTISDKRQALVREAQRTHLAERNHSKSPQIEQVGFNSTKN